jgi:hypothetical protein
MSVSVKKQRIPKPLRSEVWRKNNKTLDTECPICKRNIISADNFECGHIISEHDGGKTELPNLKAINCYSYELVRIDTFVLKLIFKTKVSILTNS